MSDERAKILSAYVELRDALQRFLLRRTGSRETAEDLTQETWLRLAGATAVPAIANPRAYIFRTAANLAIDHGRRQAVLPVAENGDDILAATADPAPSPERAALSRAELARLAAVIEMLPPRARDVFVLARFDGLTYAEIGARLGISPKTAFSHMTRALLLIDQALTLPPKAG